MLCFFNSCSSALEPGTLVFLVNKTSGWALVSDVMNKREMVPTVGLGFQCRRETLLGDLPGPSLMRLR